MYFPAITLLLACLCNAQGFILPNGPINMLFKSDAYLAEWSKMLPVNDNSVRSPECLAAFLKEVNELSEEFDASYGLCLENAEEARAKVQQESDDQRVELKDKSANTCAFFNECDEEEDASAFFDCYSANSNKAVQLSQSIGASANQAAQNIKFSNQKILYEQTLCTSAASQAYSEKLNNANAQLNHCLSGKPPITTTPTTATEPSIPPSTEAPTPPPSEDSTTTPDGLSTPEDFERFPEEDIY